jgi:hypothetical protein
MNAVSTMLGANKSARTLLVVITVTAAKDSSFTQTKLVAKVRTPKTASVLRGLWFPPVLAME